MTVREQKRLFVIGEHLAGRWSASQAADKLELSLRQMRRLLAAFRRDGPAGLVHGNRGRAPPRRIAAEIREEVLSLSILNGTCSTPNCRLRLMRRHVAQEAAKPCLPGPAPMIGDPIR